MKLVNFLQIRKDDVLFTTQRLRQRGTVHLRNVVIDNVLKRANVINFGLDKFLHYQHLSSAKDQRLVKYIKVISNAVVMGGINKLN